MTSIEYSIEKSILSTILFAYHQKEDMAYFENVELYEENFQDYFHKLVVKQINHNKARGLSVSEEYITEAMAVNGTLTDQMLEIMAATPFSRNMFKTYFDILNRPKLSSHWDI